MISYSQQKDVCKDFYIIYCYILLSGSLCHAAWQMCVPLPTCLSNKNTNPSFIKDIEQLGCKSLSLVRLLNWERETCNMSSNLAACCLYFCRAVTGSSRAMLLCFAWVPYPSTLKQEAGRISILSVAFVGKSEKCL